MNNFEESYKLILIGDEGVGKTSLLNKFMGISTTNIKHTVGIDYDSKIIDNDGTYVKLDIWDTSGNVKFRNVITSYFNNKDAIILLFDLTNLRSYQNIKHWITLIYKYVDDPHIYIIGTKSDLFAIRVITNEMIDSIKEKYYYLETTITTSSSVNSAFYKIISQIINKQTKIKKKSNLNNGCCVIL